MAKQFSSAELTALFSANPTVATATNITGVAAAANIVTVTSAAHGCVANDLCVIAGVGGATEANSVWRVASAPTANTLTLAGITAVTAYTSGGTITKITLTDRIRDLKPFQVEGLADALKRVPYTRGNEANYGSGESAISQILV